MNLDIYPDTRINQSIINGILEALTNAELRRYYQCL